MLVARRADILRAVAAKCGERVHAVVADMTRRDDVQRVVREAIGRFGRIDVWVNNVGQGISRPPSALTDEDIDAIASKTADKVLAGIPKDVELTKEDILDVIKSVSYKAV